MNKGSNSEPIKIKEQTDSEIKDPKNMRSNSKQTDITEQRENYILK